MREDVEKAIVRKALGYEAEEVVEEFDRENELIRRKVTTKHYPPDMSAVKVMAELRVGEDDIDRLSDAELEKLKTKLLLQLKDMTKGDKK